jgi:hypothetical protein
MMIMIPTSVVDEKKERNERKEKVIKEAGE